jgi:hypothetical protein
MERLIMETKGKQIDKGAERIFSGVFVKYLIDRLLIWRTHRVPSHCRKI